MAFLLLTGDFPYLRNDTGYVAVRMLSTWRTAVCCQSVACYRRWPENARSAQRG